MSKIEELTSKIESLREHRSGLLQRIEERERVLKESREAVLAGEDEAVATATASRTEVQALREAADDVEKRLHQAEKELQVEQKKADREEAGKAERKAGASSASATNWPKSSVGAGRTSMQRCLSVSPEARRAIVPASAPPGAIRLRTPGAKPWKTCFAMRRTKT